MARTPSPSTPSPSTPSANPFTPGFGLTPTILAGRDVALEEFTAALAGSVPEARAILISGARGSGKTVLLSEFRELALEAGWTDLRMHTSSTSLIDELRGQAIAHLRQMDPEAVTSRLTSARVSSFAASRDVVERYDGEGEAVTTVLDRLAQLADEDGGGLLITLDELQSADRDQLHALTQHVQDLIGSGHAVAFLAAGVRPGVDALLAHERTTFLRRAHRIEVGSVDVGTAAEAIRMTIADTDRSITPEAAVLAGEISQGYPYLIQLVGSKAWQNSGDAATIEIEDVRGAREAVIAAMIKNVHGPALRGLSARKREYLRAMLEDEGPSAVGDIAERMGIDPRNQSTYRERLIEEELIRPAGRGFVEFALPYLDEALRHEQREGVGADVEPDKGLTRSHRSRRTGRG
ncbi:AAA family ATPase [Brachybacterium saurashtrense]|uniref:ATP-binding protein n=1 Tax=Brachybacterium saurashtrense TaxID=556288 RepID=A0A345YJZ5_9MICO|nr:AAA family ATPase [Brachybacterium saurashtrense]AXK44247.1 ATP-binding protein [Brachybacterium saurashtrense]RRR21519.1 ATP-binding protein [Brachybacterium saurashtrense]